MAKRPKLSRKQRFLVRQEAKDRLERVRILVEKHLERYQPAECRLVTHPGAVLEHDGNWYVQVEPDVLEISSVKYTDRLLKVEAEIERAEGLRVMLLSMLPMGCELEFEMPVLWRSTNRVGIGMAAN